MGDFISGRNTKFRVTFNNNPWNLKVKTWNCKQNVENVNDGVDGEDADRLQTIHNFWECQFACYDDENSTILENILAQQAAAAANLPQLPLNGGILFKYNDGATRKAFTLVQATLGAGDFGHQGRVTRVMHNLSFRARYLKKVQAA